MLMAHTPSLANTLQIRIWNMTIATTAWMLMTIEKFCLRQHANAGVAVAARKQVAGNTFELW